MKRARILIVDDSDDVRSIIAAFLHRDGYKVKQCADGAAALKAQDQAPFDVLITDIFMPERDGIETIAEFHRRYPQTRIIAMSGTAMNRVDYLALSLEIGAHRVLRKPFDVSALEMALEEVLNETRAPHSSGP